MQLAFTDARAIRMLQVLLAACDPLDKIQAGSPPEVYEKFAVAVLADLRFGADADDIVALLGRHGVPESSRHTVAAFADAAVDWWQSAEARMPLGLGLAG